MKTVSDDTIVAISTPPGKGAIGIVRLSGPHAIGIAGSLIGGGSGKRLCARLTHTLRRARLMRDGVSLDDALVALMKSPRSYTGEDMVEFHCHGNPLVLAGVVGACLKGGARAALPGEFTRRAFINGKIDLSQAEAVAGIIEASSGRALELAMRQAGGELSRRVARLGAGLLDIRAGIEARLEFPEEELTDDSGEGHASALLRAAVECRALITAQTEGMRIRDGVRVVIIGKPNAGKSSIFNRLLRAERAIVTPERGTTRDPIEETVILDEMAVTLVDTAGICRDHGDEAGKAGVARSMAAVDRADLLLCIADASVPWSEEDHEIAARSKGKKGLLLLNKADLPRRMKPEDRPGGLSAWDALNVSATRGDGIEDILKYIKDYNNTLCNKSAEESAILCSAHQSDALHRCSDGIQSALELSKQGGQEELVSLELEKAYDALGDITGENAGDELLDRIFSRFCIGK